MKSFEKIFGNTYLVHGSSRLRISENCYESSVSSLAFLLWINEKVVVGFSRNFGKD